MFKMTREIKFRAWNKNTKKFNFFDLNTVKGRNRLSIDYNFQVHRELEQFLGFKAKDSFPEQDIYEGDILENWDEKRYLVQFNSFYFEPFFEVHNKNCKVIGNIHENPELLINLNT
jgi:hypothetical protein